MPAFGTWAHGLYLATETLLLLTTVPKVAAGRVCRHCLYSFAADGALFEDTASFDFAMSPNKNLPTQLYGRSAAAEALQLSAAELVGFSSCLQVSAADATTPVNKPSTLTRAAGAISGNLQLPAYSVTQMH